jgi:large subunit ribosomal protein L16
MAASQPRREKFRKQFRGRRRGMALRGSDVTFGEFGLKAMGRAWMSANQIEAGRRAITNSLKRKGKLWIRVFPDKPITSRPAGQRMGSGKGEVSHHAAVVKPGRIIYEIAGVEYDVAAEALRKAGDKMPFKTKIITRD